MNGKYVLELINFQETYFVQKNERQIENPERNEGTYVFVLGHVEMKLLFTYSFRITTIFS